MLIDTHTHLYWDEYKPDLDQIVQRSLDAKVSTVICIGVDINSSQQAADFHHPLLTTYSTIGIHPHEAQKYQDPSLLAKDLAELEKIYHQNPQKIIAVGECGLDYFFQSNDMHPNDLPPETQKDLQRTLLLSQLTLAQKLDLPIIIHCRDDRSKNPENIECWNEILEIVKDWRGILHCYSGMGEITEKASKLNFLISFAGNITYPKNDYLRAAAKQLPLDKIVLETDCPFLSPQSRRGERNEPSAVNEIAQCIADVKTLSLAEIAHQTTQNAKSLFKI